MEDVQENEQPNGAANIVLHKCTHESKTLYTLFDPDERLLVHPTAYLRSLRKHRPPTSQRQTAYAVKQFCGWLAQPRTALGVTVDEALVLVESGDILDWIESQHEAGVSKTTISNRETLVRGMYQWFTTKEAGVRDDVPWEGGCYTKSQRSKLPRFVTAEQVIKLLNGMHNESQRVAAHFTYDTGVRVSELIRLTNRYLPDESHWPEEVNYYPMLIPGSKARNGKFKFRYTIISRPMLARVRRYHAGLRYKSAKRWAMDDREKPVFLNVRGTELTEDSIYKCIKEAWIRQGGDPTQVSPHRLRHGTAYSVLRSELGKRFHDKLLVLKGLLGHASISTTEIYSAIPIAALESLYGDGQSKLRYAEADEIYQATYLPEYKNVEKRGHRK